MQELKVGDEVISRDAFGVKTVQPVIWTGKSHLRVNRMLDDDRSGFPVRIKADALAENVPYRDLAVTSEHTLFFRDISSPCACW